jgi:acylphosphatase
MQKRLTVRLHGTVQGVGLRVALRDVARKLGVTGMVCNEPDGLVVVIAEGDEHALEQLLAWCRVGPPGAYVHTTEVFWMPVRSTFTSFEIE